VDSNTQRLIRGGAAMEEDRVTVGAFPEQVIGGYPPET